MLFSTPLWSVLDYLLQHPDQELTDSEIVLQMATVKKSAVNIALRKLAQIGFVRRTPRGRMVFNYLLDTPLTSNLKIVSNLIHVQPLVDKIASYSSKIVLFGSRAEGTQNSESDFDLFVIATEKNVSSITKMATDKIQLISKTPEQMLTFDKKEPALSREIKKGIVLWEKI